MSKKAKNQDNKPEKLDKKIEKEIKAVDPIVPPVTYNLPVNFNLAEYLAKLETKRSIEVLVELRDDEEQPGSVRRSAATDILNRGWGVPAQTVNINRADIQISEIPQAIQQHTNVLMLSQEYVGKVPVEEWPEEVKKLMGFSTIIDALPAESESDETE